VIAAIGAFDGFHLGHQTLIELAAERARNMKTDWGVITFTNHPDTFFAQSRFNVSGSLFVLNEQRLLEKFFSVPRVHRINFTQEIAMMTPDEFFDYIGGKFRVEGVVVGEDFRFGRDRSGTPEYLMDSCARRGWSADVIPMRISSDGRPISSTVIREAVSTGEIRRAWELLGYPFFHISRVIHGDNRGTALGFPTANIELSPLKTEMRRGVYATLVHSNRAWFTGAANVGVNPTFGDISSPRFEVNLLDYCGDLYGHEIAVFILDHIRDEIRFENTDRLIAQITEDAERIKSLSDTAFLNNKWLWEKFSKLLK
jgi:riboflavin kinase/FMN adenylyltransferase